MRDVELVETDGAPAPASDVEHTPSFLDRVRRRPRWLAAGAAVVVALVGYQLVSDQRVRAQDDARAAALADVPFVLDPVDPAFPVFLEGSWSWEEGAPPVVAAFLGRGVSVSGLLVSGGEGAGTGEARLAGVDPSTAEVVWETTLPTPQPGAVHSDAWCSEPESADATSVRCVLRWQVPPAADATPDALWTDLAVVVEVDGADGSVLRRTDVPAGASLGTGPWGMVVGTLDGTRVTLDATGWDGTPRWTRTLDLVEVGEETYLSVLVVDDRVLVADAPEYAGWVLSADDGRTLLTLEGTRGGWGGATLLPGGAVLVADSGRPQVGPGGQRAEMLVLTDGTEVSLDGDHREWVGVDDGTLGDALLTGTAASPTVTRTRGGETLPSDEPDGSVARLREPDGSVRWEVPGLDVQTAIAVDGLVVARTSDEVVAVDARTGRVRWRLAVPSDDSSMYQLLTDGRVILAARGAQLDAISFRGEPVWSAHVQPQGDGRVVVPGPAPTPGPTETAAPAVDQVMWNASTSGRLVLGVMTDDGEGQEYVVFGR
ncbi:PQQ-like beta-propeller repeat protein [Cellulomonas fimi]|uniref:outer membrane protein assembly factor BamB family protein n=1 Tax=Cellulomonas fimi TaxID=1708 RepID=UPI00234DBA47|nr:PQQ-binding-like beta-propeller repeat protein [Cellulomonas fimi]MDC7122672.1 PQQ-like beta-propeller repeat protein [Cellulomonas fimi]